jgi:hypothetical protein
MIAVHLPRLQLMSTADRDVRCAEVMDGLDTLADLAMVLALDRILGKMSCWIEHAKATGRSEARPTKAEFASGQERR